MRDSEGNPIAHAAAKWFFLRLSKKTAPWAFQKGEAFRSIASLEMLATLLGIMLLAPGKSGGDSAHKADIRFVGGPTTWATGTWSPCCCSRMAVGSIPCQEHYSLKNKGPCSKWSGSPATNMQKPTQSRTATRSGFLLGIRPAVSWIHHAAIVASRGCQIL